MSTMHRVSHATVNTDNGEYYHSWPRKASIGKPLEEILDGLEKVHPEWTSMVITFVKVRI